MALHMNPYLIFDGRTREALELYHSILGGDLQIMTFGDMGSEGPVPPPDGVMHAFLGTEHGFRLMASDGGPDDPVVHGTDFAVALNGDAADEELMRGWWEKFAAAGTIDVPLEKQMWGDWFGQVTDPFGIAWMFNIAVAQQPGA
ncbi:VOC family protein [Nocardioides zeae]|uniref:VOC family protein n=1 Tax=Nocardioides imazamoxiresistens TaxID=3231893 RepID=A0ABU3PVW9_9ACTN|nr:VOC family protein [Nocardioides zeae]MDT9592890.1 VOC family protein [Nocardioides zeae]